MKRFITRSILVVAAVSLFPVMSLFAGDKPSVAVSEFRNETSAGWWSGGVGNDLAGMLTNELASTGNFRMVERQKLNAVLDEQDLASSGRISKKSGAKIGKITGAQYVVVATVSSYEEQSQGGSGGISFRGISLGGKKDDAYIAVDLRVVDTTTGEVAFTRTVEARSTSYGVNAGVYKNGLGGDLSKYNNTPAGKAIRGVVMEISDYLSCAMVEKGDCMDEYNAKESTRRAKTKKAVKLE